ncbi:FG-GAP repeat domain-containing protein [Hydrogenimonas sp.]
MQKRIMLALSATIAIAQAAPSGVDFNRDGVDDLFVRNSTNGAVYSWLMKSDGTRASYHYVATIPSSDWTIEGMGDFNGDGTTDVLVRNTANGQTYSWLMNTDGTRKSYSFITTLPESDWEIVGTDSDFDGDEVNDIVVRNKTHGWTYVWLMNADGTRKSYNFITTLPESDWEIAGTDSDFNGDGVSDIVVRNKTHGWTYVWLMNADGTRKSYNFITTLPFDTWEILETAGTFNGDTASDLAVRKLDSGDLYIWLMNADGTRKEYKRITAIPESSWQVVESRCDFDGDGIDDFVVRNLSTGLTYSWLMNSDGTRKAVRSIATIPVTSWEVAGKHGVIHHLSSDRLTSKLSGNTFYMVDSEGISTVTFTDSQFTWQAMVDKDDKDTIRYRIENGALVFTDEGDEKRLVLKGAYDSYLSFEENGEIINFYKTKDAALAYLSSHSTALGTAVVDPDNDSRDSNVEHDGFELTSLTVDIENGLLEITVKAKGDILEALKTTPRTGFDNILWITIDGDYEFGLMKDGNYMTKDHWDSEGKWQEGTPVSGYSVEVQGDTVTLSVPLSAFPEEVVNLGYVFVEVEIADDHNDPAGTDESMDEEHSFDTIEGIFKTVGATTMTPLSFSPMTITRDDIAGKEFSANLNGESFDMKFYKNGTFDGSGRDDDGSWHDKGSWTVIDNYLVIDAAEEEDGEGSYLVLLTFDGSLEHLVYFSDEDAGKADVTVTTMNDNTTPLNFTPLNIEWSDIAGKSVDVDTGEETVHLKFYQDGTFEENGQDDDGTWHDTGSWTIVGDYVVVQSKEESSDDGQLFLLAFEGSLSNVVHFGDEDAGKISGVSVATMNDDTTTPLNFTPKAITWDDIAGHKRTVKNGTYTMTFYYRKDGSYLATLNGQTLRKGTWSVVADYVVINTEDGGVLLAFDGSFTETVFFTAVKVGRYSGGTFEPIE